MNQQGESAKRRENLNIVNHIGGRLKELKKLYNDVATTKSEMLIHQMLPNHLRRRAMSHNAKRLPQRYRKAHTNQMSKSGSDAKKKRPSRKFRRRPRNLMLEYNRRNRKNIWLETHIWHAKRFRMKNLWGYRVPFTPTNKRYRASYKGANHHCLLQDISYYSCIEISGLLDILQQGFKRITSPECGLTLNAKSFLSGTREGKAMIFKRDSYPLNAIAEVKFLWMPHIDDNAMTKTIWIFIHPGVYKETLQELKELFEAFDGNCSNQTMALTRNAKHKNDKTSVEILELKDTLNRFQLTGPFSNAVLFKSLKLACNSDGNWVENLSLPHIKARSQQNLTWNDLQKTGSHMEFKMNGVLGLVVQDPRANKLKQVKAVNNVNSFQSGNYLIDVSENVAMSPIWDKSIRDELFKTKMTTSELCKLRNKNQLLPGIASSFELNLQPVPILLIQRPSISSDLRQNGFGGGWDVIIPSSYGLHFWLSFVKFGAKPIGLNEQNMLFNEIGCDISSPDSLLGKKELDEMKIDEREKYFRLPPNKRTNYRKMKIASPFSCPFDKLVKEWECPEDKDFYILRNSFLLRELDNSLYKKINCEFEKIDSNALIPIILPNDGSRNDSQFSIICVPKKCDIKKSLQLQYFRMRDPVYIETPGDDENSTVRKSMKFHHSKLLKRLRNRRVRLKRKLQATSEYFVKIQKPNTEKIIEEHFKKMCELWLPSKQQSIRNQCSREVFGYIVKSRFCFSEGRVCGIGYVTRNGLRELMKVFQKFKGLQPFVLTRSTSSLNYYKSKIHVNG